MNRLDRNRSRVDSFLYNIRQDSHTGIEVFSFFLSRNPKKHLLPFIINILKHRVRTPSKEIAFTARSKMHSQIFRYDRSIFCLPHRPKFSDFFDLCLHWVSVVRVFKVQLLDLKYQLFGLRGQNNFKNTDKRSFFVLANKVFC